MSKDIRQKKKEYSRYALVSFVLVIAILIVANLLLQRVYKRWDLTQGKIYSISSATKSILKELKYPITIKVFVSKDLPSPYNKTAKYLRDLLGEYKAYSGLRISVEFMDPKEKPEYQQMARELGVTPVRVNVMRKDKFELVEGYLGFAIIYGTKREVVPVVTRVSDLEYIITSKIVKLMTKKQKKVGFLKGHGEIDFFSDEYSKRLRLLKEQYVLQDVILKNQEILDDNDLLVIAGPSEDFSDTELYYLDQYIMKGKPVIFMLDAFDIDLQTFSAKPISNKLFPLLRAYGVNIDTSALIADMQNEQITVSTQQGFFTVQNFLYYPYFLKVTNFNREHPVVKPFTALAIIYASPIYFNKELEADTAINYTPVIFSSKYAWLEQTRNVNPYFRLRPPSKNKMKQFVIAAEVRGAVPSYFTERNAQDKDSFIARSTNARFMVVSTSTPLQPRYVSDLNLKLFFNMIDYLVQDQRLIQIRSKGVQIRYIKNVPHGVKLLIKYINMFLIPVLLVVYGILRWQKIRRRGVMRDE